jgi:hypothetical protein
MSALPELPARVENAQHFAELVSADPDAWYTCIGELHDCATKQPAQIVQLSDELHHIQEQMDNKVLDLVASRTRTTELEKDLQDMRSARDKLAGITEYQDNQIARQLEEIIQLRQQLRDAIQLATPAVTSPASVPTTALPAEVAPAVAAAKAPLTPAQSSATSRLSERLPDPAIFDGDRKDFRRFQAKIHQKMKTNADRFPTARERMSYVTNRLEGQAYAQILPFILEGECQLSDYPDVLRVLERAYGDPNRVNNARKDLFRLKQQNKEFAVFYAEFQRLALEGEVSEDFQVTLLESALSRELKSQLTSVDAPDHNIYEFSEFLQKLENKRRYYNDLTDTRPPRSSLNTRDSRSPSNRTHEASSYAQKAAAPVTDPDSMDLSTARQSNKKFTPSGRRERSECYRCGSKDHFVGQCPRPPPAQHAAQLREGRTPHYNYNEDARSRRSNRTRSPSQISSNNSAKGVALT